jgi:hypothetical protein
MELCGFGGAESVAPGLNDRTPLRFDAEIGLELADGSLTEHSGIEDEGLGSSVASIRHSSNIGHSSIAMGRVGERFRLLETCLPKAIAKL